MVEVVRAGRVDLARPRDRVREREARRRLQHEQFVVESVQRVVAQGPEAGGQQRVTRGRARRLGQHLGAHDQLAARVAIELAPVRAGALGHPVQPGRGEVDRGQQVVHQGIHALDQGRARDRLQRRAERGQAQLGMGDPRRRQRDQERKDSASSRAHVRYNVAGMEENPSPRRFPIMS